MGTTEQKLNKIKQTKRRLNAIINSLGGGLTESSKFSDYPLALSQLYSRLPKTTYQEGTNINLGKTLKAVVQYEDDKVLYGDTEQDTTTGKNLCPTGTTFSNVGGGQWYDNLGNILSSVPQVEADDNFIQLEANTQYTISLINYSNIVALQIIYLNNGSLSTYMNKSESVFPFTSYTFTTGTISKVWIRAKTQTGSTDTSFLVQLEKGSTATSYEQYCGGIPSPNPNYPQDIQVVTGTQEVVVRGKNLLKLASETTSDGGVTTTISDNNVITWSGTPNRTWCYLSSEQNFSIKAGTYKFSINQATPNNERIQITFIGTTTQTFTIWQGNTNVSVTLDDDKTKVRLAMANIVSGTTTSGTLNLQIESGSNATTYEPYITPTTYQVHLGSLELAKIGTYQDYIYFDVDEGKWYKKGYIGNYTFTGASDETWYLATSLASNTSRFWTQRNSIINSRTSSDTNVYTLSPKFKGISWNAMYQTDSTTLNAISNYNGTSSQDGRCHIRVMNSIATTEEGFKTWLSNNNLKIYYVLQNVSTTEITDTTLIQDLDNILAMMSVEGTTIIEVSGNLPAPIKVRAVKGE